MYFDAKLKVSMVKFGNLKILILWVLMEKENFGIGLWLCGSKFD